jgi:cobalt transporter subunit CbtB
MTQQTLQTTAKTIARSDVLGPAVLALLLGAFLVLGTGFAHSDTIHNAAHDSRHSFAFPCH